MSDGVARGVLTAILHSASPRVHTTLTAAVEKRFAVCSEPKKQAGVDEHRISIDIHPLVVAAEHWSDLDMSVSG